MRTAPAKLAFFMILITITRVALFLTLGLRVGWLGYAFAIGLAAGVYVSAYFFRRKPTWLAGLAGLFLFGISDLWFNEMELIRSLSTADLILPTANFMNYSYDDLRWFMEYSALFFGAIPTAAAAVLGWMQSGAEKIVEFEKPSPVAEILLGVSSIITNWELEVAGRIRQRLPAAVQQGEIVPNPEPDQAHVKEVRRWKSLTAEDVARIPKLSRPQITMEYGVSDGAAGEWIRRINEGDRPWIKDPQLPDSAA